MDLNIDLNILDVEPAEQYHAKAREYLSSHQLLDFMKSPWLHRKKVLGLIEDKDSPAYLVGRAAHVRILEGRDVYETAFALGGPINPKTDRPFGANTKAFAEWRQIQGKPVLSHDQVELVEQMASGVAMNDEAVDLLLYGRSEGVVRAEYCGTPCQIRIDWVHPHRGIVDFKTCDDLTWFESDARRYGYHRQMAFYRPGTGNLEDWHPVPTIIEHTDDAKRLLIETREQAEAEYSKAEDGCDSVGTTVWGRVSEQVRKLSLLYAVSENHQSPRIGLAAVQWASEFIMHQTRRMLFMAASHVADNPFHAECLKLLEKLRDAPGKELPHSVLLKRMKMDAKTFGMLIETLAQQGDIEVVMASTPGRNMRAYRLVGAVKEGSETSAGGER